MHSGYDEESQADLELHNQLHPGDAYVPGSDYGRDMTVEEARGFIAEARQTGDLKELARLVPAFPDAQTVREATDFLIGRGNDGLAYLGQVAESPYADPAYLTQALISSGHAGLAVQFLSETRDFKGMDHAPLEAFIRERGDEYERERMRMILHPTQEERDMAQEAAFERSCAPYL